MKKIALLPLDDRPACYDFPKELAGLINFKLLLPPREYLGSFMTPGNPQKLSAWIKEMSAQVNYFIISLDALAYGNLIASRHNNLTFKDILKNIEILKEIKRKDLLIYGFSSLMRTAPTSISEEEAILAQKIIELSENLAFKLKKEGFSFSGSWENLNYHLEALEKNASLDFFKKYLKTRTRNFLINQALIELANKKIIDYLIIGIDDTKRLGLNILEKESLKLKIKNLNDNASIYTGLDEAPLLLLGRLANIIYKENPKFYLEFYPKNKEKLITLYEDRPLGKLINEQIEIIGGEIVSDKSSADIYLLINAPLKTQKEAVEQKESLEINKNILNLVCHAKKYLNNQFFVSVADLAYANGADANLVEAMAKNLNLTRFSSYAAWNTSGNTIGTVISQSVLNFISKKNNFLKEKKQVSFLLERFLDDWLYQTKIRKSINLILKKQKISVYNLGENWKKVENLVKKYWLKEAIIFSKKYFNKNFKIKKLKITLPWPRTFEAKIKVNLLGRN